MPTCCRVPGCSNRDGVAFPKDAVLRAKWIQAVRQESSVVCHSHFTPTDYITETSYGTTPTYRNGKADAVPSIFLWTSGPNGNDREERLISRNKRQRTLKAASVTSDESDLPNEFICDADTNVAYECEVSSISQDDTLLISDSTSSEVHVCDCLGSTSTFILADKGKWLLADCHGKALFGEMSAISGYMSLQLSPIVICRAPVRRGKFNLPFNFYFKISERLRRESLHSATLEGVITRRYMTVLAQAHQKLTHL
ncbi:hypothetical protein ScPMuIL_015804 [Solemya velum]